ncbi:MAG: S49 family peptidase, partial [Phocaeicola sp.]
FDVVNTHEFSDMGSIGRSLKSQEREAIQQMVNDGYETFVSRCAEGRNTSVEAIKKVGEGRIWTGEMAKQLGLVDQLGGIEEAILLAAQNADITAYSLQYYPEQEGFLSMLIDSKDSFLHSELKKSIGKYASVFQFIQHINSAEPIQARIPFELIIE